MKLKQFLIIPLTLWLGLVSCRPERKATEVSAGKQSESEPFSGTSPSAHTVENSSFPSGDSNQSEQSLSASQDEKLSDEEKLLHEKLLDRARMEKAEVFNVPLPEQVAKDRSEAWEKLTPPNNHTAISKEQLLYAHMILDRYGEAPRLEKLVFWRLIDLRVNNQGRFGTSPIIGENTRQLRMDLNPKLMAVLYSAIGESPEMLPDFLAYRKGIEMLQAASGGKSPDR